MPQLPLQFSVSMRLILRLMLVSIWPCGFGPGANNWQYKRVAGAWLSTHCQFLCSKLDRLGVCLLFRTWSRAKTMKPVGCQPLGISWAMR